MVECMADTSTMKRRFVGIGLGAVVLGAVVVAGVAVRSVLQSPPQAAQGGQSPNEAGGDGPHAPAVADRSTLEAVLASVQVYVNEKDFARADAIFREAIGEYADDQDLRMAYADLLMMQNRMNESYQSLLAALAIGPREAHLEFRSGTLATTLGMHDRAEEHFAAAQLADPSNADYPLYLANERMQLGRKSEAMADLVRASVLDPDRAIVWGTIARLEYDANKLGLAAQHIAKARRLEPRQVAWKIIEARVLKRAGDPEAALVLLTALGGDERRLTEVVRTIAESYGLTGRPGEAAAEYLAIAQANVDDEKLWFETALWQQRVGELEAALASARRALELGHPRAAGLVKSLADG